MKKFFFLLLSLASFNTSIRLSAMHITPFKKQLFELAKMSALMNNNEEKNRNYIETFLQVNSDGSPANERTPQEVTIVAKKKIGYDVKKPKSFLPQGIFSHNFDQMIPNLSWDIRGIQKYAIQQYKNSLSWFQKHPFQFATLVGLTSFGTGWFAKNWWQSRK
jgi:hypothetical protein